ncbi:helix-turn-helix domain-containing protein [Limosilactobacillus reuteri]|uniref:Helix-turn-helix domain-containing protein n=1 Tax=Limosilactobacillus reuteri TaxID=1598 RepID=A0AB36ACA4_LIMRT|nr:helix-turn-helix transcriptional regulator [Limosilactobacillus reuteri]MCH5357622.1 helix-turn-helix transcriptional regulator [Limosilactobacillus reuteri]MRG83197.1 helix-turn-helix domain-containing protein [Limosilactobacillus reuteri]
MNAFQTRLQAALNESGMTQAELARKTGIGRNSISDYLKGKYLAKQQYVGALARVLNVDEGWLMGVSDKKERRHPEEDFENTNKENGDITDKDIDHYFNGLRSYKGLEISDEQKEFMRNSIKSFLESQRAMNNKQNRNKE